MDRLDMKTNYFAYLTIACRIKINTLAQLLTIQKKFVS
jgi:hypothetical protein